MTKPLSELFHELRHDKNHHLGLGDIRLTVGQQEEIEAMFAALEAERDALKMELVNERKLHLGYLLVEDYITAIDYNAQMKELAIMREELENG